MNLSKKHALCVFLEKHALAREIHNHDILHDYSISKSSSGQRGVHILLTQSEKALRITVKDDSLT